MYGVMKRSAAAIILLSLGVASFVYGMRFHRVAVTQEIQKTVVKYEEQKKERTVPWRDPTLPPPDPNLPPDFPPDPMFRPQIFVTETYTVKVPVDKKVIEYDTRDELEPVVVLETTQGGVELDSGSVTRTYSLIVAKDGQVTAEKPPGCPT